MKKQHTLLLCTLLYLSLALTICLPTTSDEENTIMPANIFEIDKG